MTAHLTYSYVFKRLNRFESNFKIDHWNTFTQSSRIGRTKLLLAPSHFDRRDRTKLDRFLFFVGTLFHPHFSQKDYRAYLPKSIGLTHSFTITIEQSILIKIKSVGILQCCNRITKVNSQVIKVQRKHRDKHTDSFP